METFIDNVKKIAMSNCSYTVEVTPTDELIPYIHEIKEICISNFGAPCHITIARDDRTDGIDLLSKYTIDGFYDIWKVFDSPQLELKKKLYSVKRNEFCYAGAWSYYLNLNTGDYWQCYQGKKLGNIYENTSQPLADEPVGCHCPFPYCYNGHSFLALGVIPEINEFTYADVRDRNVGKDNEWLKPQMRDLFESRLCESNLGYSAEQKYDLQNKWFDEKFEEQENLHRERLYKIDNMLEI
jgi:hypothetical protein